MDYECIEEYFYDFFYFNLILTLMLLCRKSGIATNLALFELNLFCLKFGLCKENDILQLCWQDPSLPSGPLTFPTAPHFSHLCWQVKEQEQCSRVLRMGCLKVSSRQSINVFLSLAARGRRQSGEKKMFSKV